MVAKHPPHHYLTQYICSGGGGGGSLALPRHPIHPEYTQAGGATSGPTSPGGGAALARAAGLRHPEIEAEPTTTSMEVEMDMMTWLALPPDVKRRTSFYPISRAGPIEKLTRAQLEAELLDVCQELASADEALSYLRGQLIMRTAELEYERAINIDREISDGHDYEA